MEIISEIEEIIQKRTCIVGMGNYLRGDDSAGLYIIDHIQDKIQSDLVALLNVEEVLENYIFKIINSNFENVLLIDAVKSTLSPGAVLFGELSEFDEIINNYSTHKLSLLVTERILERYKIKTYLLGITVADINFGAGISDTVKRSADILCDLLINTINERFSKY